MISVNKKSGMCVLDRWQMAPTVAAMIMLLSSYGVAISANSSLVRCDQHIDCICPGSTLVFECTIVGGIATVWKGNFFDCPSNSIILRHRVFQPGISRSCRSGAITANGIEVINNSYASQLIVIVDSEMNNGSVECIAEGSTEIIVGTCPLSFATGFHLPPDGIRISDINSSQFTIRWSPPESECAAVTYDITTINCGVCPKATTETFIVCKYLSIDGQVCSVILKTKVCDNSTEHIDVTSISVSLKVPSPPEVMVEQINFFTSILTTFNETEQFYIADGIDGSATFYTITYSDFTTGDNNNILQCVSVTIPASLCIKKICSHIVDLPINCNNSNITTNVIAVTVFATNILGDGRTSNPVIVELENTMTSYVYSSTVAPLTTVIYSSIGGIFFIVLVVLIVTITIVVRYFRRVYSSDKNIDYSTSIISIKVSNNLGPTIARTDNVDENESIIAVHSLLQSYVNKDKSLSIKNQNNGMDCESGQNEISQSVINVENAITEPKYCEANDNTLESFIYENSFHDIDKMLNLDSLLIQIRHQVSPKWYQFGVAIGLSKELLDEFSNFPPEECIVEVLDCWLRISESAVTWMDVADALKDIGFHQLAETILKAYKIGTLPVEIGMEQSSILFLSEDNSASCPPLPPRFK